MITCHLVTPPSPINIPHNSAKSLLFLGIFMGILSRIFRFWYIPLVCHHFFQFSFLCSSFLGIFPYFLNVAINPFLPADFVCAYCSIIFMLFGRVILLANNNFVKAYNDKVLLAFFQSDIC